MEFIKIFVLPVIYALLASLGYALMYQVRGTELIFTSFGGGLGWAVYLFVFHCFPQETDVLAYMCAAMSVALFAEIMAIVRKRPALLYSTIAIFPIVPGAVILRTMEHLLQNDMNEAIFEGLYSLQISGAIAFGILVGSSLVRIVRKGVALRRLKRG